MGAVRYKDIEGNQAQEIRANGTYDKTEVPRLVERAANGSFGAFGELYSIYLDQIYRYVFYQVRDKMAAEDLTEEIFLKAWEAIGRYKQKSLAFSAWLYRIAHNHVVDYFRTRRQHVALDELMPAASGNPAQEAEEKLMQQELAQAISYLPPEQKQIIILKFIEGLDNQEIAQIMRKRQGAIRVMQMRALTALRQILTSEETKCKLSYLKPLMNV
jgi:RNA polymerase sigma-70 factor (ECF subfamily)